MIESSTEPVSGNSCETRAEKTPGTYYFSVPGPILARGNLAKDQRRRQATLALPELPSLHHSWCQAPGG